MGLLGNMLTLFRPWLHSITLLCCLFQPETQQPILIRTDPSFWCDQWRETERDRVWENEKLSLRTYIQFYSFARGQVHDICTPLHPSYMNLELKAKCSAMLELDALLHTFKIEFLVYHQRKVGNWIIIPIIHFISLRLLFSITNRLYFCDF